MTKARDLANLGAVAAHNQTFRNRIINGDMRIDQRNAGASVTVNPAAPYPVDRWNAYSDVANMTGQRSTVAPTGFINSMVFTVTGGAAPTAGQISRLEQRIEGQNVADLAWGTASAATVTVSFLIRSSVTGTHSGVVANLAGNRNYPFTFNIASANTWEYKTVTIPGDTTGTWATDNTTGMKLMFNLGTGSTYLGTAGAWGASTVFGATGSVQLCATGSATLYLAGVQLEKGTVATPFEFRPIGTELALCQRYYLKTADTYGKGVAGVAYATNALLAGYSFPVQMRSDPTVTISANGTSNSVYRMDNANVVGAVPAQTWWDKNGFVGVQANSPFVANLGYSFGITASAEL